MPRCQRSRLRLGLAGTERESRRKPAGRGPCQWSRRHKLATRRHWNRRRHGAAASRWPWPGPHQAQQNCRCRASPGTGPTRSRSRWHTEGTGTRPSLGASRKHLSLPLPPSLSQENPGEVFSLGGGMKWQWGSSQRSNAYFLGLSRNPPLTKHGLLMGSDLICAIRSGLPESPAHGEARRRLPSRQCQRHRLTWTRALPAWPLSCPCPSASPCA